MPWWLHLLDGLLLLLVASPLVFVPGVVRDAIHHLTREDLPE